MEGFNNENLSDFFDLIGSQKKKSSEETTNPSEETSLDDLFASVSEEKKKEKKKRKEIIGDVSLDDLFSSLSEEKKKLKGTEIEKKQEIEQLEKEAKAFESFLYSESTKKEEKLEEKPPKPKKSKKKTSKKDVIVNKIEEKEEIKEKVDQNLQKSLDILDKLKRNDIDIENEEDPALRKLKLEVEQLRKLVESSIRTATAQGGGGEVRLEFLDDVDRDSAKVDGKFLKYDSATGRWVGANASGGGNQDLNTTLGLGNTSSIGMSVGVITATSFFGDGSNLSGVGAGNTTNVRTDSLVVSGISTFSTGIGTVNIGVGNTTFLVDGDARVTGILTVGRSSITIDGVNDRILIGNEDVTISDSSITIGDNVTINTGATGINSAPNVFYVAKDGNDSNNGTSIDNAKLTISGAVSVASSGAVIKVLSGNYVENNPIELPAFTAVIGDDLRTVKVLPNSPTSDIFHVNKACKLANITFSGHLHPAAAVAFPTGIATNVGGGKWKGPYIQNCTSDTTTGTGIRIDGNLAVKTKSMNVDAFTQYNQGGVGVAVTNEGYAQLVSVFTICCNEAISCHAGGQADLANSNCSFGTFGLVADGKGTEQFTGIVTSTAAAAQDTVTLNVGVGQTRPYDGQIVYFDQLYKEVETITITNGGSGYTNTPSVTISSPTGPNGEVATAFATIENGTVTEIDIISNGSQYTENATITISAPDSGTTATATANMADIYYTINSATPIVSGITTLTLAENLLNTVGVGSTVFFFQQSRIIASSHTFEYIGSGNQITSATPKRGGVTIQANEVVSKNGGKVIYTSTDQAGNFRIGDDFQINQNTGTISGRAFSKSLFSEMTPFILALS